MRRILALFLLLASFFVPGSRAETLPDFSSLRLITTAQVSDVIDPLRVRLTDGTIVQLAGLDVPDLDPHEPGKNAQAAQLYLSDRLKNKQIRLYQTKDPEKGRTNRMGYALGHLVLKGDGEDKDDLWINGTLLEMGFARLFPGPRNPEMATAMIDRENHARLSKQGLWADSAYRLLTPDTAAERMDDWGIVEGTVFSIATVKNTVYLNFGPDWRTDFTIVVESAIRKAFGKQGIDLFTLQGKTLRVHGWLERYNGPAIKLSDPAWLEILETNNALSEPTE
ncbi:MAG: thermonuclease family protein [Alphaproteobacteria bacterium]|nr:thermonuclease family protein [Alphaproteobacteria bacterium]